jgi:hypothetical protein
MAAFDRERCRNAMEPVDFQRGLVKTNLGLGDAPAAQQSVSDINLMSPE